MHWVHCWRLFPTCTTIEGSAFSIYPVLHLPKILYRKFFFGRAHFVLAGFFPYICEPGGYRFSCRICELCILGRLWHVIQGCSCIDFLSSGLWGWPLVLSFDNLFWQADAVFLSPPWGGPSYLNVENYDLQSMLQPFDGVNIFQIAHAIAPNLVLFLPRNVDIDQVAALSSIATPPLACEVEKNFVNGKLKAITAYYGEIALKDSCWKFCYYRMASFWKTRYGCGLGWEANSLFYWWFITKLQSVTVTLQN